MTDLQLFAFVGPADRRVGDRGSTCFRCGTLAMAPKPMIKVWLESLAVGLIALFAAAGLAPILCVITAQFF